MSKWPGTWKCVCDVCGFWFYSDQLQKRWDGLMCCEKDWEVRHPSTFVRTIAEHITPPWVRPPPPDQFIYFCNLYNRQAIAGVGVAGCAIAGYHADYVQDVLVGDGSISTETFYLVDDFGNYFVNDDGARYVQ